MSCNSNSALLRAIVCVLGASASIVFIINAFTFHIADFRITGMFVGTAGLIWFGAEAFHEFFGGNLL